MTSDSVTCLRSRKRKHSQATAVESSLLPYDPLSCNCRPAACHEAPTPCFPSSGLKGDLSITGRRCSAECRRLRHFRACCALVEPFPCLAVRPCSHVILQVVLCLSGACHCCAFPLLYSSGPSPTVHFPVCRLQPALVSKVKWNSGSRARKSSRPFSPLSSTEVWLVHTLK